MCIHQFSLILRLIAFYLYNIGNLRYTSYITNHVDKTMLTLNFTLSPSTKINFTLSVEKVQNLDSPQSQPLFTHCRQLDATQKRRRF